MSEKRKKFDVYFPPYSLGRGFAIARFAVGEAMMALAHDLSEVAKRNRGVEVRWPTEQEDKPGAIDSRAGVKLVKVRDISSLQLPGGAMPLADAYEELDKTLPALNQHRPGVITDVGESPADRHGRFVVGSLQNPLGIEQGQLRHDIVGTAMRLGRHPAQPTEARELDVTLAYVYKSSGADVFEEVLDIARQHSPIPFTLESAVKHPDPTRLPR